VLVFIKYNQLLKLKILWKNTPWNNTMPYVKNKDRKELNDKIHALTDSVNDVSEDNIEGVLNYVITTLLTNSVRPDNKKWKYNIFNRAIGILECVKLEFYRRLISQYEAKCIDDNGDIKAYKECLKDIELQKNKTNIPEEGGIWVTYDEFGYPKFESEEF
jgi:hypothetical protein